MPNVIHHKTIKPAQLFHLNERTADLKRPIDLSAWLKFQDYGFLAATLDRIRLDAQHDAREYGFSQLRLVVAFLRWTNLKEAPNERINSPLILLPATLTKRKGVKDSFRLDDLARRSGDQSRAALSSAQALRYPTAGNVDADDMDAICAISTAIWCASWSYRQRRRARAYRDAAHHAYPSERAPQARRLPAPRAHRCGHQGLWRHCL